MNATFDGIIKGRTQDQEFEVGGGDSESLLSLCNDLFIVAMTISPDIDMRTDREIRQILQIHFNRFTRNCEALRIKKQKWDPVLYALVALIDEKVLSLPDKWSTPWRSHLLQLDYFGEMIAGEVFFDKLQELKKSPCDNYDVLEIYYLCLCLGFKGMYQDKPEELEEIITALPKIILEARPDREQPSLPPPPRKKRHPIRLFPAWFVVSVTAAIIIGAWVIISLATNFYSRKNLPELEKRTKLQSSCNLKSCYSTTFSGTENPLKTLILSGPPIFFI